MGTVYHGVHPMQVWSTVSVLLYKLGWWCMQYAVKVNCKSEFFRGLLLMPMLCMMKCRVSLLESSILLNASSSLGGKVLSIEKQCASLKFVRNILNQFPLLQRERAAWRNASPWTAGVLVCVGSFVELNINNSVHTSRGH